MGEGLKRAFAAARATQKPAMKETVVTNQKVAWLLETGIVVGDLEGEIEVEVGATDEEIEEAVREDMWNRLSLTWRRI
jgi:hypothetical protein